MSASTTYLQNKLLNWLLRNVAFSPPATLYVALVTGNGSQTAAGIEVAGGSYARVAVTSDTSHWDAAGTYANGATENTLAITFPAPTANWGTVVGFEIWDASSGGNRLIYGALTTSFAINNGDPAPYFDVGSMVVQVH